MPNKAKNELEVVFLPDSKVGMSTPVTDDVVHERRLDFFGHIPRSFRVVSDHVPLTLESRPTSLQRLNQQRVDCAADIKVEVGNRSQIAKCRCRIQSVERVKKVAYRDVDRFTGLAG